MGQYIQCECLPANLAPLTEIDETALNYYMIHVLFDVAGAAGHVVPNGSVICNELYWKKFSWALESILKMIHGIFGPVEAYKEYLSKTKLYYQVDNDVIAKLCNLIRVSNSEEAEEIRSAFEKLDAHVKSNLERELTKNGFEDSAILMYYAPATFQNAYTYYKKVSPEDALTRTVQKVAPLLSILFEKVREKAQFLYEGVKIAFIADIATFAKNPETMIHSFSVMQVGEDFIITVNNK